MYLTYLYVSSCPSRLIFHLGLTIKPFFVELEGRKLDTKGVLESWIADRSELMDVINEEGSLRYIRMTCDTENKELEKAYFHFLEEISGERQGGR